MRRLRSWLFARRGFALAVVLAALAVRIVVPAGLMPGEGGGATFILCTGHGAVIAHDAGRGQSDPVKPDAPCAFTGLLAASLDAPVLPMLPAMPPAPAALAIFAGVALAMRTVRLHPPSRGPPGRRTA